MKYQLKPYDVLERSKWPVVHQGLYLGNNMVFHCTPENGEHISSLEEFSKGETITTIKRYLKGGCEIHRRLMKRLQMMEPYKCLSNNCEHAVSRVTSGTPDSPQLKLILATSALFFMLWVINRSK